MSFLYRIFFSNIESDGLLHGLFGINADNGAVTPAGKFVLLLAISLLWVAASYFLGSVNFSIIISKKKFGDDVRNHGSGNAGTSNMQRTYGNKVAALTLLGDISKGVLAVLIARIFLGTNIAYLAGTVCIFGHCFPCYFGFKGGKGVATSIAVIMTLNPFVGIVLVLVFIILVLFTRYISLGSIISALLFPFIQDRFYRILATDENSFSRPTFMMTACALMIAVLVVARHRQNIKNLYNRTERKLSFKKKKSEESEPPSAPFSYHNIDKDDDKDE